MATPFRLRVVSATRGLYDGPVTYLHVAGIDGEMGILAHHLPLVTALKIAPVEAETDTGRVVFAVHGGFVEVGVEGVTVLAEVAEPKSEIDVDRARKALARAQSRVAASDEVLERVRAQAALERARTRLRVAGVEDPVGHPA